MSWPKNSRTEGITTLLTGKQMERLHNYVQLNVKIKGASYKCRLIYMLICVCVCMYVCMYKGIACH